MTSSAPTVIPGPAPAWTQAALILVAGVTALRVAALIFSSLELYPDEAQYWIWAQDLDWGFYSKPPLVAWIIAVSTTLFGDSDFAIRLPAPLLAGFTALMLFLSARRIAGAAAGFWAAALYLTAPAVWVSASVIATDALLLPAWSAALYALLRLRGGDGGWISAGALGLAVGTGMLGKYAMVYFLGGTALAMWLDPASRRALLSPKGALAAAVALAVVTPNLAWNAANEFATVSHTAANAAWDGPLFNPAAMAEFIAAQIFLFGPIYFFALIAALWAALKGWRSEDRTPLLLAFYMLPPLLVVTAQSLISRAHANWAATAYAAATILVALFLLRGPGWRRIALWTAVALNAAIGLVFLTLAANPALADALGRANDFKRLRGWAETASAVAEAANDPAITGVAFDNRNVFHAMQRYGQAIDPPLYMWRRFEAPHNHADLTWPLPEGHGGLVLIVSERPRDVAKMREDFESFEPAGEIRIPLGGGIERVLTLWRAQGYHPVERGPEYEARWREIDRAEHGYGAD